MRLETRPQFPIRRPNKKLNCKALNDLSNIEALSRSIAQRLNTIPETNPNSINLNINEWFNLREIIHQAAADSLGYAQRRHRHCFDENSEEISKLLTAKNKAHDALLLNPLSATLRANWRALRSETQRKLREMENDWRQARSRALQIDMTLMASITPLKLSTNHQNATSLQ